MRRATMLGVVGGALAAAVGCVSSEHLEIFNPCSNAVRVVTWHPGDPVIDVPASSSVRIDEWSLDGPTAASKDSTVRLPVQRVAEAADRYEAGLPEDRCAEFGVQLADVIVIDRVFTDAADPVRLRVYSQQHADSSAAEAIAAALPHAGPEVSVESGLATVQFVAQGPTDWNGKTVSVDVTGGVRAALDVTDSSAVVVDCTRDGFWCEQVATNDDGELLDPLLVDARTAGRVSESPAVALVVGGAVIAGLVAIAVWIVLGLYRRMRTASGSLPGSTPGAASVHVERSPTTGVPRPPGDDDP